MNRKREICQMGGRRKEGEEERVREKRERKRETDRDFFSNYICHL
jgi:hypothetical protein